MTFQSIALKPIFPSLGMRIYGKKVQGVVNPVHYRELQVFGDLPSGGSVLGPERVSFLERTVQDLAGILKGTEYALTGGLAIPYWLKRYPSQTVADNFIPRSLSRVINGFYRNHSALHIVCFEDSFEQLIGRAREQGYELFRRPSMGKIPFTETKGDLYVQTNVATALDFKMAGGQFIYPHRNLRLIKVGKSDGRVLKHTGLLDYIDLYVHHYEKEEGQKVHLLEDLSFMVSNSTTSVTPKEVYVVSHEKGMIRLPFDQFNGFIHTHPNGDTMPVVFPGYLLKVKFKHFADHKGQDPIDEVDIDILTNLLQFGLQDPMLLIHPPL